MAEYVSEDDCVHRQSVYPDLEPDMSDDFQRRRVASSARFILSGDRVLDIGCNSGYFGEMCPQAWEVHGVDVNPTLVAIAVTKLKSALLARAEALPFTDHIFDVANVSGVLEQCYDPCAVLKEAVRVTKRSVTGNTVYEHGIWGTHRIAQHKWQARAFSASELLNLLSPFGSISHFGTVDRDGKPQCFFFELRIDA